MRPARYHIIGPRIEFIVNGSKIEYVMPMWSEMGEPTHVVDIPTDILREVREQVQAQLDELNDDKKNGVLPGELGEIAGRLTAYMSKHLIFLDAELGERMLVGH